MTTNTPTGRCPSCGIGRFLPSGLCDQEKCPSRRPEPQVEAVGVVWNVSYDEACEMRELQREQREATARAVTREKYK